MIQPGLGAVFRSRAHRKGYMVEKERMSNADRVALGRTICGKCSYGYTGIHECAINCDMDTAMDTGRCEKFKSAQKEIDAWVKYHDQTICPTLAGGASAKASWPPLILPM